jgi:Zn ribbon nucleic-acid-binding protein
MNNNEIIFIAEEDEIEGGFIAKALDFSIITEGETWEELKSNVIEAVKCHFEENNRPKIIRILLKKEEVLHCA